MSGNELDRFRQQFKLVDRKDKAALRRWLEETAYLGTPTQAVIAGISYRTLLGWRKKVQLDSPNGQRLQYFGPRRINTIIVPENRADWDNREWFEEQLKHHTVLAIAEALRLSRRRTRGLISHYGLKSRGASLIRSKHPCCKKEWLLAHLVGKGLGPARCAKLAGVGIATILSWITRFGIVVPSNENNHTGVQGLWVRTLVKQLHAQPCVRRVWLSQGRLRVSYHSGIVDRYWLDEEPPTYNARTLKITAADSIVRVPQVRNEFETFDADPVHVTLRRRDWNRANCLERRIAMHAFLQKMRECRWPKYPTLVLQKEYEQMLAYDRSRFVRGGLFTIYPKNRCAAPGRRLLEHFVDLRGDYGWRLISPRQNMKAFKRLAAISSPITTHNYLKSLSIQGGPLIRTPLMYAALLERLGIKGSLLDVYPYHCAKAVACAMLGIKYYTWPTPMLEAALAEGLGEYVGLDYEPYNGQKVDLVLQDCNFRAMQFHPLHVKMALELCKVTKRVCVYVPHGYKAAIQERFRPDLAIQLRTRMHSNIPDYVLLW